MTEVDVIIREPARDELLNVRIMRRREMHGEQAPPADLAVDPVDFADKVIHMAAFSKDGTIISTVRARPIPEDKSVYEISRMTTHSRYRRLGIGSRVLAAAEQRAVARGAKAFVLDSRGAVRDFYVHAGYWTTGRQKMIGDDTNHIMVKQIKDVS